MHFFLLRLGDDVMPNTGVINAFLNQHPYVYTTHTHLPLFFSPLCNSRQGDGQKDECLAHFTFDGHHVYGAHGLCCSKTRSSGHLNPLPNHTDSQKPAELSSFAVKPTTTMFYFSCGYFTMYDLSWHWRVVGTEQCGGETTISMIHVIIVMCHVN